MMNKEYSRKQEEVFGINCGGYTMIGFAIGTIIGYLLGGGRTGFLEGGWIDTVIGLLLGSSAGLGCAMVQYSKQLKLDLLRHATASRQTKEQEDE